jgi:hypothetical protein
VAVITPFTSNLVEGLIVPIPILPVSLSIKNAVEYPPDSLSITKASPTPVYCTAVVLPNAKV